MSGLHLRPEGFASESEYRTRLAEIDPEALPQDFLAPNDYILTEPTAISDLREKVAELAFQLEVLKARAVAKRSESTRLGRVVAVWANSSAHDQLGPYPWFKLAGAFAATFLGTRALKMLPLGSMASVAVPALLRQIQRPR